MKKLLAAIAAVGLAFSLIGSADVAEAQIPTYFLYDYPAVHGTGPYGYTHYQAHGYYYNNPWYTVLSFENLNAISYEPEYGNVFRVQWQCQSFATGAIVGGYSTGWFPQRPLGSTDYVWVGCPHGQHIARNTLPPPYGTDEPNDMVVYVQNNFN